MEESLIKSFFMNNFGMTAIALAILGTSFFGQVDEERIVGIEKEIVELRIETKADIAEVKTDIAEVKTDIAGLKEDVRRIERKLDDFISSRAAGGRTLD